MSNYRVDLVKDFSFEVRRRSGIEVRTVSGYEGELTDEQVEAIKADPMLVMKKLEAAGTGSDAAKKAAEAKVKKEAQAQADAAKKADAEKAEADRLAAEAATQEGDGTTPAGTSGEGNEPQPQP